MKVWVDQELCQAAGYCNRIAPNIFSSAPDGVVVLVGTSAGTTADDALEVLPDVEAVVRAAARDCPAEAIMICEDS